MGGTQVIRGGRVLDAARRVAEPADVVVQSDTITAVGPPGTAAPDGARELRADGRLLIPGLVNAHTHSHGALGRGAGDRWTLELLLNAGPWLSGGRQVEEIYVSTLVAAVEMVQKGCTACYDLVLELPGPTPEGTAAVAQAYRDVGMRAVVAPMLADRSLYDAVPGLRDRVPAALGPAVDRLRPPTWETTLAAVRRIVAAWAGDREQVAVALAPTIPLHCSDPFLAGCRDLARELGLGVHMHLAESKTQALAGLERYGRSLTAHLDAIGLLGPGFTAAHAIWLDADDIARLADRGASVAHNPGSNMRLGSGLAPIREMLDRRVNVGVGTDAASCSDNLNMFEAMRLASFVSRVRGIDDLRWLTTDGVLAMATAGSARALGFGERIGRIAAGSKADIVFLDLDAAHYLPLNDPVNQVVHSEDATGVERVMIGGRLVVDRGRVTTVDLSRLRARVEAAVARLAAATRSARALAAALEPVVGEFCRALGREPYPPASR